MPPTSPKPPNPAGHPPLPLPEHLAKPPPGRPPKPPHPPKKENRSKRIALSVAAGTAVAAIVGIALQLFGIPINVVLPVLAPIWVGVTTIAFTELSH